MRDSSTSLKTTALAQPTLPGAVESSDARFPLRKSNEFESFLRGHYSIPGLEIATCGARNPALTDERSEPDKMELDSGFPLRLSTQKESARGAAGTVTAK